MNVPAPRHHAHDDDRASFLEACADVWDHARERSREQMIHAARMFTRKLGGALILRGECTATKRTVPEADYVSEGLRGTDVRIT